MDPDATRVPDGQPARVLVVDDDLLIRSGLAQALSLSGYAADVADCGQEALAKLALASYDVMVLDLHMPGMHGVDVMHRAHAMWPQLSIIILTGHATLESAISAVKSRAADYLLKPASDHQVIEAVTRVLRERARERHQRRLVHTINQAAEELLQIELDPAPVDPPKSPPVRLLNAHPLTLDVQRRSVVVKDRDRDCTVELTKSEMAVLAILVTQPGQVFSCRYLAHRAMDYDLDDAAARKVIRSIVFRLRHKIETDTRQPRLIRTIRGSGYFFDPRED